MNIPLLDSAFISWCEGVESLHDVLKKQQDYVKRIHQMTHDIHGYINHMKRYQEDLKKFREEIPTLLNSDLKDAFLNKIAARALLNDELEDESGALKLSETEMKVLNDAIALCKKHKEQEEIARIKHEICMAEMEERRKKKEEEEALEKLKKAEELVREEREREESERRQKEREEEELKLTKYEDVIAEHEIIVLP